VEASLNIVTEIPALPRVAPPGSRVVCFPPDRGSARSWNRWLRNLRLLRASLRADYLVIHFSVPEVVFFCSLLALLPGARCRVVTLDLFVEKLFSRKRSPCTPLLLWALRRVHRFLVYFRDTRLFEERFRVPRERFRYVPYKINAFELVSRQPVSDGGYIFCGGRSRRDFATLFAAIKDLGYPVKLITSRESELGVHGSSLRGMAIPPNVTLLQDDPGIRFFVETAAAARLVVLPVLKDAVTQTGIGVYLIAMALGKCVIISSGLGVSDVLTDGQALIVPAGDPAALRDAIDRAWNDPALRARHAEAACRYAIPLGGEDELGRSILHVLD
jgi:glycosyltransferase involved in cell wall biosynthesis